MASVVQHGRRRGASKSAEGASRMVQPPDLRQVTVLSRAEWQRIKDELNQVNKDDETLREAIEEREALHLRSKEVVKLWSNTIAGQRQKKLEAKKIREEIEEEKRKLTDIEEAKYQEEMRREAVEQAKKQLYNQTDRVRGLHRALLLTEVMKEREAQIQLKQRIKSASKYVDRDFLETVKAKEDEALRREQEKALQNKLKCQAVAEDLKNQMKDSELAKERHKLETRKDAEEIKHLEEIYQWERRMEEEQREKQKKDLMKAHLEHLMNRDIIKSTNAQKEEVEDERRKLFLSAKQKMTMLRKKKEKELLSEAQMRREQTLTKLAVKQQEQLDSEEQRIAKAVDERDAKQAQKQRDKEEKRIAMLESIAAHRERMIREKEQREKITQQTTRDTLQAKREGDKIFYEKQQLRAQRMREDARKLQRFHAAQMAEKSARHHQLRSEEYMFEVKNAEAITEEENQFQLYSRDVINAAAEAQRNVFPLCKAAREGIGGGLGPNLGGAGPSYLAQDSTGAQMPQYVSSTTQNIKKIHEVVDIEDAKKRLGFTW
ncbi:cilia- and flagella- associated protein 210 [Scomber scombrus]|uniref:Cilia- and flagella- associated protein 210 n=1 Tax=Scomber scombrus TaxID=13677 RepID=A0AAV1N414_SCOSC|nr:cilia- and flagella- associated protein 210 [Scomber scombrus]